MYKLISIDMDATILRSDHTISAKTLQTLRRASERGVEVMINTGRTYSEAMQYFEKLDFVHYFALANGSLIYDHREDRFQRVKQIDFRFIEKVHEISESFASRAALVVSGERHTYSDQIYQAGRGAQQHRDLCGEGNLIFIKDLLAQMKDRFIAKGLLIGDHEVLRAIKKELERYFGDEIKVVFSLPKALEILEPDMDKANALKHMMTLRNIESSQIIAIGDGENDIGMLRASGMAVAMGNAADKLKIVADYVTLSNDEDGVAYAVEKLLFA